LKLIFGFHRSLKKIPPTVVDENDQYGFWGVPKAEERVDKVVAPFSAGDVYRAMKNPTTHIQLGDIHIRKGRPDWTPMFNQVSKENPLGDIGVIFCGNPAIAQDLGNNCFTANHDRHKGMFKFHKENF